MSKVTPLSIELHTRSCTLDIAFDDGLQASLSFEFLRVYSPSAEVRGHGAGQEILQTGKRQVKVVAVEPVGHYAIQLHFDDGHGTGIYSWDYLHRLAREHDAMWKDYLSRLQAAGHAGESGRDAPMPDRAGGGCGH